MKPTELDINRGQELTGASFRGQQSFPRAARLLKPVDFKRVFERSSASSDRYFKVLAKRNDQSISRLGMAVSRKIDKRAVGRNRIKRVIRESFRRYFDTPPPGKDGNPQWNILGSGLDLVVLPRPVCASICNQQLNESLENHWQRLSDRLIENEH